MTIDLPAVLTAPRLIDPAAPRRRLKLWEIEHGYHCSIVGTCLTPATARQILRRARVEVEGGAEDYRLHSLLVSEATRSGVIGRLINKTLDDSFAGSIRRVAATFGEALQGALWDELCAKGEVAAGYWAFLSHSHVAPDLRVRIFGEVHMLSHFMGGHHRGNAKMLWLAERRTEQLAERLARTRRQAQETVAERDAQIAVLQAELGQTRDELAQRMARVVRDRRPARVRRLADPTRLERRVLATRAPTAAGGGRQCTPGPAARHPGRRSAAASRDADRPRRAPTAPSAACSMSAAAAVSCHICAATPKSVASSCCTTTAVTRKGCTCWSG